jgi:peroxiredoxin
LGVQIVGVGFGNPASVQQWAEEESFEFEMWTDDDRSLAVHYGAADSPSSSFVQRLTVLLDADGNQLLEYEVGFGFGTHPAEVLADLQAIYGE